VHWRVSPGFPFSSSKKHAGFPRSRQWINSRHQALLRSPKPRSARCLNLQFRPRKWLFDREGAGIRRQEAATDLDSGSNGADDDMVDVLEDDGSDPVARKSPASSVRSAKTSRSIWSP